jgi:hypothetical protein
MSSAAAASLVHSVQFYDHPKMLVDRLCGLVGSALRRGDAALLLITAQHRVRLVKALADADIDVRDAAREGRFVMCDAAETLPLILAEGVPDRERFNATVGRLLFEMEGAAQRKSTKLFVFGELVALLWEKGNHAGALALEALWNEVMQEHRFHLHCAYPRWGFINDSGQGISAICEAHSHVG